METFGCKVKRHSPLLLAALFAQTAGATIPKGNASHGLDFVQANLAVFGSDADSAASVVAR